METRQILSLFTVILFFQTEPGNCQNTGNLLDELHGSSAHEWTLGSLPNSSVEGTGCSDDGANTASICNPDGVLTR